MIAPSDLEVCRQTIRTGSYSFHAASRFLPARIRDRAFVLYAFCRLADDAVDLSETKAAAVLSLNERLERAYAGRPLDAPVDRAFAALVREVDMPRALPEALLEGMAWDAEGRRYRTLSELHAYCARVASVVGVMMCVLMEVRDRDVLARACDLGAAMQLTNIARDVGEDALAGRLFLPLDWLEEAGLAPDDFLRAPAPTPAIRAAVARLLAAAEGLYRRSEAGIAGLPASCRPGIFAARRIYAQIGTHVARADFDSISQRARTSRAEKLALAGRAGMQAGICLLLPLSPVLHARPLPEMRFLVDAAARPVASDWGAGRAGTLLAVLAQLERRDRGARVA